jgi:putative membrane protein
MKLRTTLAALAVASVPALALAQTSQLQQQQNQPGATVRTGGAPAGSMQPGDQRSGGVNAGDTQSGASAQAPGGALQTAQGSAHGAAQAMGQLEMDHVRRTMQLGTLSLETSRLAQQRAENEDVKDFAGFEVKEQETLAEVLRSMMDPSTTASAGNAAASASGNSSSAASQRSTAPGGDANAALDARGREMMQKLQQAKGDDFDRVYLQGQIQAHQELLQAQQDYLARGKNRESVNLAKLASNQIREHIALLKELQEDTDAE